MYISLIEIDDNNQVVLETLEDNEPNRLKLHKKRLDAIKEGRDMQFVCTANRPEAIQIPRRQKRAQERALINVFNKRIGKKETYEKTRQMAPRKVP